jgi:hypothetical protein
VGPFSLCSESISGFWQRVGIPFTAEDLANAFTSKETPLSTASGPCIGFETGGEENCASREAENARRWRDQVVSGTQSRLDWFEPTGG